MVKGQGRFPTTSVRLPSTTHVMLARVVDRALDTAPSPFTFHFSPLNLPFRLLDPDSCRLFRAIEA
jgi:hypothetical protein